MDLNKLKSRFNIFKKSAQQLVVDKSSTLEKVQEGLKKANKHKGALTGIWQQLILLFEIARAYANGSYTTIPKGSIIAIVAGLLYFISPLDLIPDFIAGLGFVDDALILSLVYKQVAKDLEKYLSWKAAQKNIIHI
ncbi:DUF1232 domain-containing protein [Pedobacter sp. LMG 31464]|uniref:DUF1232 domain-containing protein n=1 Tax=Pedobacter planticolens TaxID=2679964 RepID=A0A923E1B0_9SPHI|nr:YkvA family protein [Pedobacter planticolens]MBB2146891.1 DUF1232 domain-containing protein [Pedobacter planticolens]